MKITLGQHRRLAGELGRRAQDVWLMAFDAGQEVVPENTTMKTNRWIDASNEEGLALLDPWKRKAIPLKYSLSQISTRMLRPKAYA